jgi:Domain of unknown function (DUF5134)
VTGPEWLSWPFAALMAASAVFHAARLVAARRAARPHRYDVDLTHLVMSGAMAVMLVLPVGSRQATTWSLVIAVPAGWFAARTVAAARVEGVRALGGPARQLVMSAAMLFMLLAGGGSAATAATMHMSGMDMAGMAMPGSDQATWSSVSLASAVLVAVLGLVAGYYARELRVAVGVPRDGSWLLSRGPSLGCRLAMTSAMGYMLVLMIG